MFKFRMLTELLLDIQESCPFYTVSCYIKMDNIGQTLLLDILIVFLLYFTAIKGGGVGRGV